MSLPSRTSVWVVGSSLPGTAGSGICFTQTTTFMGGLFPTDDPHHQLVPCAIVEATTRSAVVFPAVDVDAGGGESLGVRHPGPAPAVQTASAIQG